SPGLPDLGPKITRHEQRRVHLAEARDGTANGLSSCHRRLHRILLRMTTLFGHPRDLPASAFAKAESPFRDRGTDGSNPSPSSEESANFRFRCEPRHTSRAIP